MLDTGAITQLIICDREILGGTPVFAGTRVPVETLFDYLEAGDPLEVFLDDFPTVDRAQAVAVLAASIAALISKVSVAQSAASG